MRRYGLQIVPPRVTWIDEGLYGCYPLSPEVDVVVVWQI